MKFIIIFIALILSVPCMSQNRELENENTALKAEVQNLKAQLETQTRKIEELQKANTQTVKRSDTELTSETQRFSYGLGVMVGSNIQSQGFDPIDIDGVIAGLRDFLQQKPLTVKLEEAQAMMQQYMQKKFEQKSQKFREEGSAFLEKNKTVPGVKTTASGLQYKILAEGTGKQAGPTSSVTVHYTGKLINGTIFDSSVQRGQPATFRLNQVVRGWTEGLQLIKEGGKVMLFIPYNLAYGEQGKGGTIPPYATLIFEVELLKVN